VVLRDQNIDELEKQIDRLCLEFLVRQQPVAGHLRFVYATIKINSGTGAHRRITQKASRGRPSRLRTFPKYGDEAIRRDRQPFDSDVEGRSASIHGPKR
jgi:phosphate uptake regulator